MRVSIRNTWSCVNSPTRKLLPQIYILENKQMERIGFQKVYNKLYFFIKRLESFNFIRQFPRLILFHFSVIANFHWRNINPFLYNLLSLFYLACLAWINLIYFIYFSTFLWGCFLLLEICVYIKFKCLENVTISSFKIKYIVRITFLYHVNNM